jgi:hypothetical protein
MCEAAGTGKKGKNVKYVMCRGVVPFMQPVVLVKNSRLKVKSSLKTNDPMIPETNFVSMIKQRCPTSSALLGGTWNVEALEVRRGMERLSNVKVQTNSSSTNFR